MAEKYIILSEIDILGKINSYKSIGYNNFIKNRFKLLIILSGKTIEEIVDLYNELTKNEITGKKTPFQYNDFKHRVLTEKFLPMGHMSRIFKVDMEEYKIIKEILFSKPPSKGGKNSLNKKKYINKRSRQLAGSYKKYIDHNILYFVVLILLSYGIYKGFYNK